MSYSEEVVENLKPTIDKTLEYIDKANKNIYSSPKISLNAALQAVKLSKQLEEKKLLRKSYSLVLYSHYMLYNMDSLILYADTLMSMSDLPLVSLAKVNVLLSIAYREKAIYEKAIYYAEKAMEEYSSINDSSEVMNVTLSLANIYFEKGANEKAMPYYFKVLKYTEQKQDTVFQAQVIGSIANVYMEIGEKQKGLQYLLEAVNLLKFGENGYEYATSLNNYGTGLKEIHKYDSALSTFYKALEIYQDIGNRDAIASALQNVGSTQMALHRYEEGMKNMYQAMEIYKSMEFDNELVNIYYDLGTVYHQTGQTDSAIYYLTKSVKLADHIKTPYEKKESLLSLFEIYRKKGEFENALNSYIQYSQLKDSIANLKMKQSFQELEVKYKSTQKELDIQRLEEQQIIDQSRKRLLIILFVAVLLLAMMGIVILIIKRRKDNEIHQQKLIVFQQEKDLANAELSEKEAVEREIKKELEFKTKQLASHALIMMQKNTFYKDLSENIHSQMQMIDGKGKIALKQVQKSLEQSFNIEKDWDLFKLYFEQMNDQFFDKLREINPRLTPNDYKLAALIKLNMNIKETATVLNISADSLKNARYRLKRKLNIKSDLSLPEYIQSL
jgi:tetratricopeptide (TPR) repeat protein